MLILDLFSTNLLKTNTFWQLGTPNIFLYPYNVTNSNVFLEETSYEELEPDELAEKLINVLDFRESTFK